MYKNDQQILMIFMNYLNKRRSRRQKDLFVRYFQTRMNQAPYEQRTQRISIVKARGEIFGDLKKARRVLLAGLETGERRLPGSEAYHPFNSAINRKSDFNSLVLRTVTSLSVLALSAGIFAQSIETSGGWKIFLLVLSLIVAFLSFLISRGFSSKGNVSKSVSLFAASQIAGNDPETAVVLCDVMSFSKLGFIALEQLVPEIRDKLLIYLDCLGEGSQLVIGYRRSSKKAAKLMASRYSLPSVLVDMDQLEDSRFDRFDNLLVLSFADEDREGICIPQARKNSDRKVDLTMLDELLHALAERSLS